MAIDGGIKGIRLSILDRIIGLDPEAAKSTKARPHTVTLRDLEETLHRDLTSLLNTRRPQEPIPALFSETAHSVLTFGLPDFTACSALDRGEQERVRREIENAIRAFEPRLANVTVSLDRSGAPGDQAKRKGGLRYHVRALLRVEPEPEPVLFDAVLEPNSGRVAVEETGQKRNST